MNIYKLTYENKATALADLKAKGILVEVEFNGEKHEAYGNGVQAVVEIGLIILEQGTYDENGNVITPPVYADGYHYDVMSSELYDFGANLVEPKNPKHAFSGHAITEEFPNDLTDGIQE
jgi:hypothetical protein